MNLENVIQSFWFVRNKLRKAFYLEQNIHRPFRKIALVYIAFVIFMCLSHILEK